MIPQYLRKDGGVFTFVGGQSELFAIEEQNVFFYESGSGQEVMVTKDEIGSAYEVLEVKEILTISV